MRYPRASHQQRLQITLRVMFLIMQSYRLILGNNDVYFFVFRLPVSISQRGRETISHTCNLLRLSRAPNGSVTSDLKALVASHEGCVDIKNTRAPPGNSTVRQVQSLTYFRSIRNLSVCLLL